MTRGSSRGGRGSNQYQTRGVTASPPDRLTLAAQATAVVEDVDPEEIGWAFDPAKLDWDRAGIQSHAAMTAWSEAGFSAFDAGGWQREKFTPADAARLRDAGIPSYDAGRWKQAGVETTDEMIAWHREGITVQSAHLSLMSRGSLEREVRWWNELGVTEPEQRRAWQENNFMPVGDDPQRSAKPWIAIGVTDPQRAKKWLEHRYQTDPDAWRSAVRWEPTGMDPDEVVKWDRGKYIDPTWAAALHAQGVQADAAMHLRYRLNVTDTDRLIRWATARFPTPESMDKWFRGGWAPEKAAAHINNGYATPDDLPEHLRKRRRPKTPA